jgi:hypothetical protein
MIWAHIFKSTDLFLRRLRMQVKRKLLPILLVLIIAALMVAACGGGGAGGREQTWFNLPAAPLDVNPDGTLSLYGIGLPVGAVIPPDLIQQLQTANVQQLQVRAGANGVQIYANGEQMPYLGWDAQSAANLNEVLAAAGVNVNVNQLRTVGLGANLKLPPAQGQPVLDIPRWSGETPVAPAAPATESTPLSVGVTFDAEGRPSVLGLSPEMLGAMAGSALPTLDAGTLGIVNALGWQTLQVQTTPSGITLVADTDKQLPTLAYDAASLQRAVDLATPILQNTNPSMVPLLAQLATILPTRNVNLTVGFNGTPVGTQLSDLPMAVAEDGSVSFDGIDLPGFALPADAVQQLTAAGVQNLGVAATDDSILLAVNGQPLPKISFTPGGLSTVAGLASGLAGVQPEMITGGLQALANAGMSTSITLPGGTTAPAPTELTYAAPDLGDVPTPTLRVAATVQDGQITSVGGLSAEQLSALGVELPVLPSNVNDILTSLDAAQIDVVTEPNKLRVAADGADVISLEYDQASLLAAWNLAKPQLADGPLGDPALQGLIEEQFLPLLPGADIRLAITVE